MTKRMTVGLTALLVLGFFGAAYSQSLGELGRKEKERRESITAGKKPITNNDSARYTGGAVTTGTPSAPSAEQSPANAAAASAADGKGAAKSDEPVDFEGRPESFWKNSFAEARKKVQDLENEANVIVLRIADLQNRFYREDDGFKQQTIQREMQKGFYEQDLNKQNLAKARDALQALEKEARKSGALPGWMK